MKVLIDSQGHAVDLVTAFLSDSHVLLLVSPEGGPAAMEWLQNQAKEGDFKVQINDISVKSAMLTLVGPESENALKELVGQVRKT